MTTIAINGRFLSQPITGVQRYAHELIRALDVLLTTRAVDDEGIAVELLVPPNASTSVGLRHIPIRTVGRLSGQLWEQAELPFYCHGKLLFTPCGGAPILHDRHIVTIFDAAVFAVPYAYSWRYATWYRWLLRRMSRKAERVLTISSFSKTELQKWCSPNPDKVTVTHLGYEHILRVEPDYSVLSKHDLEARPFVLAVSSHNPNKNFKGVSRAMQILSTSDLIFAVAGGTNVDVFGESTALPANVRQLGYVSDAELRALYERALCFVFPSFYEGFGLPPLEAMACGCPVIVSRAASLPEICGDAASYCDPANPEDIAAQIRAVASNGEYRQRLIHNGGNRLHLYGWEQTARKTWSILRRAVERRVA